MLISLADFEHESLISYRFHPVDDLSGKGFTYAKSACLGGHPKRD